MSKKKHGYQATPFSMRTRSGTFYTGIPAGWGRLGDKIIPPLNFGLTPRMVKRALTNAYAVYDNEGTYRLHGRKKKGKK